MKDKLFKALGLVTQNDINQMKVVAKMSSLGFDTDDDDEENGGRIGEPKELKSYTDYAKAYMRSGWIFAPVNRVAQAAAQVPLRVYELDKNGEPAEVVDHPSKSLLETVNPWMTGFDLIETTFAFLEIAGKCFWLLLPNYKNPQQIWPLRPDRVKVIEDDKNFIAGYEYEVNGKKIKYPVEQIIYLHTFNPLDERDGTSTVATTAQAIVLDDYAVLSNKRYFQNDGTPGGVIKTPKDSIALQEGDLKRYKRHWDKNFKGVKNKNRTAILPPGWEYDAVNPTLQEMQFLELRKNNREEMLAAPGVPPSLTGLLEYANYSNMEAQEIFFWKFTMKPRLTKVAAMLNSFYFPRWGNERLYCEFDLSEFLADDEHDRVRTDEILLRNGLRTINELRRRDNLEEVPWGNTWWVNGMLVPVESLMNKPTEPKPETTVTEEPIPSAGEEPEPTDTNRQPSEEEEDKNPNEPDVNKVGKAGEELGELEYDEEELDILEKAESKIKSLETKFIGSVTLAFDKQESAILSKLKKVRKDVAGIDIEAIITAEELTEDMVDASAPLIMEAVAAGAADLIARQSLGIAFDVNDKTVTKFIREKVMFFVNTINQTTYDRVRQGLIEGVDAGETEKQLAERVRIAFDGRRNNAATIARTEIGEGYQYGHFKMGSQAKAKGLLSKKSWITAKDELVRPWHARAHRQTVDIDEPFDVMDEELMYPNDRSSGASGKNTINCRCAARYLP